MIEIPNRFNTHIHRHTTYQISKVNDGKSRKRGTQSKKKEGPAFTEKDIIR